MIANSYLLKEGEGKNGHIQCVATQYIKGKPISWAVILLGRPMSKITGIFCSEPEPNERTPEHFKEFRFGSALEAAKCWSKFALKTGTHC